MSLLLRISIVFVALVYMGQLRRKQSLIRSVWLGGSQNPANINSSHTAQLIRQYLASQASGRYPPNHNHNHTGDRSSDNNNPSSRLSKIDDDPDDLPPNYEDALNCPVPETLLKSHKNDCDHGEQAMQRSQSESLPTFDQIILHDYDSFDANTNTNHIVHLQNNLSSHQHSSNVSLTIENNKQ